MLRGVYRAPGCHCGIWEWTRNVAHKAFDRLSIEGRVRDISCPLQNKAATAVKFNLQCARQCIKQGSPIIILSKDGEIYIPISDSMPDKSQRERLLPFIGKYVRATGHVFERGGSRAIALDTITEMKNVHLITDAQ